MPVEAMNEFGRRGWGWGENGLVRWDKIGRILRVLIGGRAMKW